MIHALDSNYSVRPLSMRDIDGPYPSWFQDQTVCRYNSHGKLFQDRAALENYISGISSRGDVVWAIDHIADGHIGNLSLQSINWINRTAEFAILIGNKTHWGSGIAKKSSLALIEHGFNKLNLNRIYCGTAEINDGMKRLAAKLGMKEEGVRRQQLFLEGQYVDLVEFGLLKEEYTNARHL